MADPLCSISRAGTAAIGAVKSALRAHHGNAAPTRGTKKPPAACRLTGGKLTDMKTVTFECRSSQTRIAWFTQVWARTIFWFDSFLWHASQILSGHWREKTLMVANAQSDEELVTASILTADAEALKTITADVVSVIRNARRLFDDKGLAEIVVVAWTRHEQGLSIEAAALARQFDGNENLRTRIWSLCANPAAGLPIPALPEFCERIVRDFDRRQMKNKLLTIAGKIDDPEKVRSILAELALEPVADKAPMLMTLGELLQANLPEPEILVPGLLRKPGTALVGGAPKTCKSWAITDLALSLANESAWLGFQTRKARTVIFDAEVGLFGLRRRFEAVALARGFSSGTDDIAVVDLTHSTLTPEGFAATAIAALKRHKADVAVIDPIYLLVPPGESELLPETALAMIRQLHRIVSGTGVCLVGVMHYPKGADGRAGPHYDRLAGSSVWARWGETLITVSRHATEADSFVIEVSSRHFSPVDPVSVRWEFPLLKVDPSLAPRTGGRAPKVEGRAILEVLGEAGESGTTISWLAQKLAVSRATILNRLADLTEKGYVGVVGTGSKARRVLTGAGRDLLAAVP